MVEEIEAGSSLRSVAERSAKRFSPATRNSVGQVQRRLSAIPSRRHSFATLSLPGRPASTLRILSSAGQCWRVFRLIPPGQPASGVLDVPDFLFIVAA
ncbi:hypothetical protein L1965_09830 [Paracoccus sp. EGI L200073]|nr:hypothetical protein [Paracoccus salsus]